MLELYNIAHFFFANLLKILTLPKYPCGRSTYFSLLTRETLRIGHVNFSLDINMKQIHQSYALHLKMVFDMNTMKFLNLNNLIEDYCV